MRTQGKCAAVLAVVAMCFSLAGCSSNSTSCPDYEINSQAELDELAGVTCVGNLRIEGCADVTDLSGLESLTEIKGDLIIRYNDVLESLDGLDNVDYIAGDMVIVDNASLSDLNGLISLTGVRSVVIRDCPTLPSLDGLQSVLSVPKRIYLRDLPMLESLEGLSGIEGEVDTLRVRDCDALSALSGLEGVSSVRYWCEIRENASLQSLSGLDGLESFGQSDYMGHLNIAANPSLTSVDGLESLEDAFGYLFVSGNSALTDLDGLSGVTTVYYLSVSSNGLLTDVSGLDGVMTVGSPYGGWLSIIYEDSLTSLGMDSLQWVRGDFTISWNPNLPCNLAEDLRDQVLQQDGIDGDVTIEGNLGC